MFFTLFNLQGARRSSGGTLSLPLSKLFVKYFFQILFRTRSQYPVASHANSSILPDVQALVMHFFQEVFSGLPDQVQVFRPTRTLLSYQIFKSLSSTFFEFLRISAALSSDANLSILSDLQALVKHFFHSSGTEIPSSPLFQCLSQGAQLIYQTGAQLSTLFYVFL